MDIRCSENMIMMMLFGLLEREEDREAMDRMMVEAVRRGGVASASPSPEGRDTRPTSMCREAG